MITLPTVLVLAHAASAPMAADPFVALRETVAPTLACERSFDAERRQIIDAGRAVWALPRGTAAEQDAWSKAYAAVEESDRAMKTRRSAMCKDTVTFEQLKARLAKLRPDLPPGDVHRWALGFFHELRRTAEYAADFKDGYAADHYTPPPAPPAPARRTPG